MAKEFRKRYLRKLCRLFERNELQFPGKAEEYAYPKRFSELMAKAGAKNWIVYAKRPFSGPAKVLEYPGRYTHRVAISNHRIVAIDNGRVSFTCRDRKDENRKKTMNLAAVAFIRRFLLHVLPDGFMKIRYFGFLASRHKSRYIGLIRHLIHPDVAYPEKEKETIAEIIKRLTGLDITCCPRCGGSLRAWPLSIQPEPSPVAVANSS